VTPGCHIRWFEIRGIDYILRVFGIDNRLISIIIIIIIGITSAPVVRRSALYDGGHRHHGLFFFEHFSTGGVSGRNDREKDTCAGHAGTGEAQ
jgi:hypothetical protein